MLKTDPLTRSRALDLIAERLRDQFGDELQALYVLPDNPYEPAGDDEWIVLAAVFDDPVAEDSEVSKRASQIACAFENEIDWQYVLTVFTLSATDVAEGRTEVARTVNTGGVRL